MEKDGKSESVVRKNERRLFDVTASDASRLLPSGVAEACRSGSHTGRLRKDNDLAILSLIFLLEILLLEYY